MKSGFFLVWMGLTLVLVSSCSQPRQLVYLDVTNFNIQNLSFPETQLGMDLRFYNPNRQALTLKDAALDLYINNSLMGKAVLAKSLTVPGKDTFYLPIIVKADLAQVFQNAMTILFDREVDISLDGHVLAGKGLFYKIPVRYKAREILKIQ